MCFRIVTERLHPKPIQETYRIMKGTGKKAMISTPRVAVSEKYSQVICHVATIGIWLDTTVLTPSEDLVRPS